MKLALVLSLLGAAAVVTGIALFDVRIALIVAGLFCLLVPALPLWEDED